MLRGFDLALAPGGRFVVWAFALLALGVCVWGTLFALRNAWSSPRSAGVGRPDAGDAVAFAATAATLALLGQVAFLLYLRFLVQPWYYATAVLVVAIAIDVVVQRGVAAARVRATRSLRRSRSSCSRRPWSHSAPPAAGSRTWTSSPRT